MKTLVGNKVAEMTKNKLDELVNSFEKVEIDLGTGDGRLVYKNALQNKKTLFIGIDPNKKQLETYAKKALRNKLENTLFIVSSIEQLPQELKNTATAVFIILPWGTLLKHTATPNTEMLTKIANLLKSKGVLTIIFGYAQETEPSETNRLDLEKINGDYIKEKLIPEYAKAGLDSRKIVLLKKEDLKKFESTWCKKLAFGKARPLFLLEFERS